MYHGDINLGDTLDVKFSSRRFSTGAPYTLAGSPSVAAYPDNSTTEITAGITLTVDFDSRTGLNNVRVVASGGNGYATATNYTLVITAGTVDSVSVVGECVGSFSIEKRSSLRPTTAGRTLDVATGGEAGIDWANIANPTGNQPDVNVEKWNATSVPAEHTAGYPVATIKDGTGTGEIDTNAGVVLAKDHSGGNLATAAALAIVQADTDDIQTRLPAALVSGRMDASVGAMAANVVTAAAVADGAIDAATFAANAINSGALASDAVTEIQSGLALASDLATVAGYVDTEIADIRNRLPAALVGGRMDSSIGADALGLATAAALATVQADTDNIQTRLPAALVSGRMDSDVGAIQANVVNANALATDAGTEIANAVRQIALTEGYAADGVAPTLEQALFMIMQNAMEFSISGTTLTVKKLDGSTTAMTVTLDSATSPTSRTRAS